MVRNALRLAFSAFALVACSSAPSEPRTTETPSALTEQDGDPCTGDWDDGDLSQVRGTFLREGLSGLGGADLLSVSFVDAKTEGTRTSGTYSASFYGSGIGSGSYEFELMSAALPTLRLKPAGSQDHGDVYALAKWAHDDRGRVSRLCLVQLVEKDTWFVLRRIGL